MGKGAKRDTQFAQMIEVAAKHDKPVRIGVNWGSLDQALLARIMDENASRENPWSAQAVMYEALITSAIENAQRAEELGLGRDKIILSCKVSGVQDLIAVYRELSRRCDYPLHLGLTEAGMGSKGIVASTAALSVLLQEGIGDTIRISLTPEPGGDRTKEVVVGQEILQTMGLRKFTPMVIACPGCGRTTSTVFQELADDIQSYLREQMPEWKKLYPGVEAMNVAVMGCIVNGRASRSTPISASACPAPANRPPRRCLSTARKWRPCAAKASCRSSRPLCSTTCRKITAKLKTDMSKAEKITAIKGMNDLLPSEAHLWELFENTAQSVVQSYGFQQIRTPIVEETRLFSRAIGAVTDIVERRCTPSRIR